VAYFDKVIPPGGEGKISIRVKTRGSQGKITRSARVYTSDPTRSLVRLTLTAQVRPIIFISSPRVYITARENQSLTKVIEIKAGLDRPLTLTPGHFSLAEKLSFSLKEMEEGRTFQILLTSVPGPPQTYRGFLKLTTNYPEKPALTLWIKGRILKENKYDQ
jgi:hypothetical protein